MCPAELYEHARQETGRGTPANKATSRQPMSRQQPSSSASAAVPAASPRQEPDAASSPGLAASPAHRPSYQDFESESEASASTTPGKSARLSVKETTQTSGTQHIPFTHTLTTCLGWLYRRQLHGQSPETPGSPTACKGM